MEAAKAFANITKDENDMKNATKNLVIRHKLNRDIELTEDFRDKYLT